MRRLVAKMVQRKKDLEMRMRKKRRRKRRERKNIW
jgi:hypothetical protein